MARAIESEADHLDRLVGNLLDMSRLQAGALVLHRRWNALEEIAADVAARAWQLYEAERVQLVFADDMPPVYCDYALMQRALSNIAENALRYEPPQSRVIIRGELGQDDEGAPDMRVAFVNHGATIPAEEKDVIMEPFHQSRDVLHTSGGHRPLVDAGSREEHVGLGLAIARGIVEAHQGRIWVEDTPGGGATFIVSLPLKEHECDVDSRG